MYNEQSVVKPLLKGDDRSRLIGGKLKERELYEYDIDEYYADLKEYLN
jgi:hypothetical protein